MEKKIRLFLDSGAFSAFTQGVKIDIQEYIQFIKKHEEYLEVYANLDVIGDAEATWKNQKIMEAAGLNPLPCFHFGEPINYLIQYIENYDYIALGGVAQLGTSSKIQKWMDPLFRNYICDSKGMPKVKIHGFGLTSHKLMWRYPWYSVDSTSWVITGRLGSILVPKFRKGKWDYRKDPWKIAISARSPSKKDKGKHLSTFSSMEQRIIQNYLDSKGYIIGESKFRMENENYKLKENEKWNGKLYTTEGKRKVELIKKVGLCNSYELRDKLNISYYLDLEKLFPEWPWAIQIDKRKGFF